MNLNQLAGFVEVASTQNFTRAAEALHLTQPSLSRQILLLEKELSVELFHRASGKVVLTKAGELLLPIARRILADSKMARAEMAAVAGLRRGRIRLGTTPALCGSLVFDALKQFHRSYPDIDIEILERGSADLIKALTQGTLDLALLVASDPVAPFHSAVDSDRVLRERLVVVSAATQPSPFGGHHPLSLREVAPVPQLMFPKSYALRTIVDHAYAAQGLEPNVLVEGLEMTAALRCVERGIGVAIVPAMVAAERDQLCSWSLQDSGLVRYISVARRSGMQPHCAAMELQKLIRRIADGVVAEHADEVALVSRLG